MLFLHIHTHTVETCLGNKPGESSKLMAQTQEETKKAGIKVIGSYVAPHEHTMYTIIEAGDLVALEKVLMPMTLWGNARLVPIMAMEQAATIRQ
jgi:uncharacterized protein with GYD domain